LSNKLKIKGHPVGSYYTSYVYTYMHIHIYNDSEGRIEKDETIREDNNLFKSF